jgi:hypothetical protein
MDSLSIAERLAFGLCSEDELKQLIRNLLTANWESDNGPIRLRRNLTLSQVEKSLLFSQTRLFLRLLHEDKGAQLTVAGNLTRAGVASLSGRMPWPRRHYESLNRTLTKVVNERDVFPLHIIRIICECADLTSKRRNRLTASRRAQEMCEDGQAGALFRHLFVTFFRRFSLDYLSPFAETPEVQRSAAFILWVLHTAARRWRSAAELVPGILLPYVRQKTSVVSSLPDASEWILEEEILAPLEWFGMLESSMSEQDRGTSQADPKYRKTPLFDQFLSFKV